MFADSQAFSSFSVSDVEVAHRFYSETLGMSAALQNGMLVLRAGGGRVLVYPKDNHEPASFTVLNFPVADLVAAVDDLVAKGVTFQRYPGFEQDERGIAAGGGQRIAWFADPAGNVLAVLEGGGLDDLTGS